MRAGDDTSRDIHRLTHLGYLQLSNEKAANTLACKTMTASSTLQNEKLTVGNSRVPQESVFSNAEERSCEDDTPPHDEEQDEQTTILRHVSLENLNPVHECESRRSSVMVAVISLVATTCGGGVLSLPLAFSRAGIIPATIFMIYGVVTNDFSLYVLVSCARRTGGRTYGDVAKSAFGCSAEVFTTLLLGLLLLGVLTAYLVLVKDIWTPVVLSTLPLWIKDPLLLHNEATVSDTEFDPTMHASKEGCGFILFLIVLLGMPLMMKHDLHALRHTSYVGFVSCCTLMVAIVFRAYEAIQSNDPARPPIKWYSKEFSDYAFSFPIVILCYMCSFNVLGVHSSLLNPTRSRVKLVLDVSMMSDFVLFYCIGLGGYLYALDGTCDNILLNFPMHDSAILLGRLGFCFTLLFGLPLVTLPCREAFISLPQQVRTWRMDQSLVKEYKEVDQRRKEGAHLVINGVDFDQSERFMVTHDPEQQHITMLTYGSLNSVQYIIGSQESGSFLGSPESTPEIAGKKANEGPSTSAVEKKQNGTALGFEEIIHYGSTIAVVGFCYAAAISVPGVGFVWSLAGSSMGITIGFVVPSACYLKIREHKRLNVRSVFAWVLFLISCIAAPVCTQQAISNA